jgi:hypothetical protein
MTRGVSPALAIQLAKIDAMQGLPMAAQFEGKSAFYQRLTAIEDGFHVAKSRADAIALIERLAANDPGDISYALTRLDFAALIVRVRDKIPSTTKAKLVAKLEVLAAKSAAAVPLLVALAPERYAKVFTAFRPSENLTSFQNPLVSPSLTSALATLPTRFAEQARQAMVAGMNACAMTPGGDEGTSAAGANSRRSYELLLARLGFGEVREMIKGLADCGTAEVCKRIDAFHDRLFAGVTSERGNPGFANVIAAARILQKNLPEVFKDDSDGVYLGGSFTNGKWRKRRSDIDLAFDKAVARRIIDITYDRWQGKDNAIAHWLRNAEHEATDYLGVTRDEGKLFSLAFPSGMEFEPQGGFSHFGMTGYFLVRVTREKITLVVVDPTNPGDPIFTRTL